MPLNVSFCSSICPLRPILKNFDFFLLSIKIYISIITLRILKSIEVAGLFTYEEHDEWKWLTYVSRQALYGFFLSNWVNLCNFQSSLISSFWLQESNLLLPVLLFRLINSYLCLMQFTRMQSKHSFLPFFSNKKGLTCNPMCVFSISWIRRLR